MSELHQTYSSCTESVKLVIPVCGSGLVHFPSFQSRLSLETMIVYPIDETFSFLDITCHDPQSLHCDLKWEVAT